MNLTDIHRALVARLRERFDTDSVPTIACYPDLERSMVLPAIIVELSEFDPAEGEGTGRLLLDARFEARVVVDPTQPGAHVAVRSIAAALAHQVAEMIRIAPGLGHNRVIRAGDDAFRPELDGYLCWVVEWACEIPIGELEPDPFPTPTHVHLGQATSNGADRDGRYNRVMS